MGKYYTQGILFVDGHTFYTLERPWIDNKKNISCIPEGKYPIYTFKHPKWGEVIGLRDVLNRSEILIHPGNYVDDTEGCILPGINCGRGTVLNSRKALQQILKYRNKDYIIIEKLIGSGKYG